MHDPDSRAVDSETTLCLFRTWQNYLFTSAINLNNISNSKLQMKGQLRPTGKHLKFCLPEHHIHHVPNINLFFFHPNGAQIFRFTWCYFDREKFFLCFVWIFVLLRAPLPFYCTFGDPHPLLHRHCAPRHDSASRKNKHSCWVHGMLSQMSHSSSVSQFGGNVNVKGFLQCKGWVWQTSVDQEDAQTHQEKNSVFKRANKTIFQVVVSPENTTKRGSHSTSVPSAECGFTLKLCKEVFSGGLRRKRIEVIFVV